MTTFSFSRLFRPAIRLLMFTQNIRLIFKVQSQSSAAINMKTLWYKEIRQQASDPDLQSPRSRRISFWTHKHASWWKLGSRWWSLTFPATSFKDAVNCGCWVIQKFRQISEGKIRRQFLISDGNKNNMKVCLHLLKHVNVTEVLRVWKAQKEDDVCVW